MSGHSSATFALRRVEREARVAVAYIERLQQRKKWNVYADAIQTLIAHPDIPNLRALRLLYRRKVEGYQAWCELVQYGVSPLFALGIVERRPGRKAVAEWRDRNAVEHGHENDPSFFQFYELVKFYDAMARDPFRPDTRTREQREVQHFLALEMLHSLAIGGLGVTERKFIANVAEALIAAVESEGPPQPDGKPALPASLFLALGLDERLIGKPKASARARAELQLLHEGVTGAVFRSKREGEPLALTTAIALDIKPHLENGRELAQDLGYTDEAAREGKSSSEIAKAIVRKYKE